MNRNLQKKISAEFENVLFHDGYLIFAIKEHVIGGVCIEKTSDSYRLWEFYYLLFDRSDALNFNISFHIADVDTSMSNHAHSIDDLLLQILSQNYQRIINQTGIDFLFQYFEKIKTPIRNEWVQKTEILTLAFLGKYSEAEDKIKSIKNKHYKRGREQIAIDYRAMLLQFKDPSRIKNLLLSWEIETIEELKLPANLRVDSSSK